MVASYRFPAQTRKPKLLHFPSLTLAQLAAKTQLADRQTSRTVRLRECDPEQAPRGMNGWQCMRGLTHTDENGHQYQPRLFWQGNAPLTRNTPVVADCQCGRHVFTYEYANAQHGSSFIYRSNGQPALDKNPGNVPGLCKHAYGMARYLLGINKQGKTGKRSN